jgi:hypothetical protein
MIPVNRSRIVQGVKEPDDQRGFEEGCGLSTGCWKQALSNEQEPPFISVHRTGILAVFISAVFKNKRIKKEEEHL